MVARAQRSAPHRGRGIERVVGEPLLELAHDLHRVVYHRAVIEFEHRHEALTADALHERAVLVGDPDRLHLKALVREGERDALDVRRERRAVEAHHPPAGSSPGASMSAR